LCTATRTAGLWSVSSRLSSPPPAPERTRPADCPSAAHAARQRPGPRRRPRRRQITRSPPARTAQLRPSQALACAQPSPARWLVLASAAACAARGTPTVSPGTAAQHLYRRARIPPHHSPARSHRLPRGGEPGRRPPRAQAAPSTGHSGAGYRPAGPPGRRPRATARAARRRRPRPPASAGPSRARQGRCVPCGSRPLATSSPSARPRRVPARGPSGWAAAAQVTRFRVRSRPDSASLTVQSPWTTTSPARPRSRTARRSRPAPVAARLIPHCRSAPVYLTGVKPLVSIIGLAPRSSRPRSCLVLFGLRTVLCLPWAKIAT